MQEHGSHLLAEDEETPEQQRVNDSGRLFAAEKLELPEGIDERLLDTLGDTVETVERPYFEQDTKAAVDLPAKQA